MRILQFKVKNFGKVVVGGVFWILKNAIQESSHYRTRSITGVTKLSSARIGGPCSLKRIRVMAQRLLLDYLGHLGTITVSGDDSGVTD